MFAKSNTGKILDNIMLTLITFAILLKLILVFFDFAPQTFSFLHLIHYVTFSLVLIILLINTFFVNKALRKYQFMILEITCIVGVITINSLAFFKLLKIDLTKIAYLLLAIAVLSKGYNYVNFRKHN